MISCNRMGLPSLDDEIKEVAWGGYLRYRKCRYGEVADYNGDDKSVEIICQEGGLDATDKCVQNHTRRQQKDSCYHWHSGPKFSSAQMDHVQYETSMTTHRADMAALAPSNIFATAIMLLMRQSAIQTMCATLPYLIRTISNSV